MVFHSLCELFIDGAIASSHFEFTVETDPIAACSTASLSSLPPWRLRTIPSIGGIFYFLFLLIALSWGESGNCELRGFVFYSTVYVVILCDVITNRDPGN